MPGAGVCLVMPREWGPGLVVWSPPGLEGGGAQEHGDPSLGALRFSAVPKPDCKNVIGTVPKKCTAETTPEKFFVPSRKSFSYRPEGCQVIVVFLLQGHHSRIFRTAPEKFFAPSRFQISVPSRTENGHRPETETGKVSHQKPEKFSARSRPNPSVPPGAHLDGLPDVLLV